MYARASNILFILVFCPDVWCSVISYSEIFIEFGTLMVETLIKIYLPERSMDPQKI